MPPRPQSAPTGEELVDLALGLLEEGGPDAATLRSVSHAAGVSTQVLYSRFGSKADLLAAMAVAGLDRLDRALARTPPDSRGRPDPSDLARTYQRFARDHPHVYDLLFTSGADKHRYPEPAAAAERVMARFLAAVSPYESDPIEAKRIVDLAWASAHGVITLERTGHLADPDGELVARVTQALLPGSRPPAPSRTGRRPQDHEDHPPAPDGSRPPV